MRPLEGSVKISNKPKKQELIMNQPNKLESLTFLRFIAAAAVVLYHFGAGTVFYSFLPSALKTGPLLVTFFFVLSGFVIAIANFKKNISAKTFYINRFARIFPIYAIALIFFIKITDGSFESGGFLLPLTMLQAWWPGYALIGNTPSWSISVEMFFYLVAPGLILMLNSARGGSPYKWILMSLILLAASLVATYILAQPPIYKGYPSASHDLVYYSPLAHISSFILGFAGGVAYKSSEERTKITSYQKIALFILSLITANILWSLAVKYTGQFDLIIPYSASYFALPFLAIIYTSALANNILTRLPLVPFWVLLGESSYSLYILQLPVNIAITKLMPANYLQSQDSKFLFYFVILTATSIASYKLIEIPMGRIIKDTYNRFFLISMPPAKSDAP